MDYKDIRSLVQVELYKKGLFAELAFSHPRVGGGAHEVGGGANVANSSFAIILRLLEQRAKYRPHV